MPSNSRIAFDKSAEDVERLLEIHADVGGDSKGRRFGLEVLNKSAVVLLTAIWEAYCEDIAAEALEHIVNHVHSAVDLPKELKKRLTQDINSEKNELAMWDLAGDGWKARILARLSSLMEDRNRRLNTPKANQIEELFASAIGLPEVTNAWQWNKMSAPKARAKLDKYVELRGAIAHRGAAASGVKKAQVTEYLQLIRNLVSKTGGQVNSFVKSAVGSGLE